MICPIKRENGMNENAKLNLEIVKISLEIEERKSLLSQYYQGIFNRNQTIKMIRKLRISDPIIKSTMIAMNLSQPSLDTLPLLDEGTNEELINEIKWQLDVLVLELEGKASEEIVERMSDKWRRI